jgi:hypothetical protein
MFMKQKDGQQQCYRCQGQGCWGCERKGTITQCPGCAARDGATKSGNNLKCGHCGTVFTKAGVITKDEQEPEKPRKI